MLKREIGEGDQEKKKIWRRSLEEKLVEDTQKQKIKMKN
jgi:hypothetical protein